MIFVQEADMFRAQNQGIFKQLTELKTANQMLKEEASSLVVNVASIKEVFILIGSLKMAL